MSKNSPATRPNPYGVVSQVDKRERFLRCTSQLLHYTAAERATDDAAVTDASNATFLDPDPRR